MGQPVTYIEKELPITWGDVSQFRCPPETKIYAEMYLGLEPETKLTTRHIREIQGDSDSFWIDNAIRYLAHNNGFSPQIEYDLQRLISSDVVLLESIEKSPPNMPLNLLRNLAERIETRCWRHLARDHIRYGTEQNARI